jgi:hypothetical protein
MSGLRREYQKWHDSNMHILKQRYMQSFARYLAQDKYIQVERIECFYGTNEYVIDDTFNMIVDNEGETIKYYLRYIGDDCINGENLIAFNYEDSLFDYLRFLVGMEDDYYDKKRHSVVDTPKTVPEVLTEPKVVLPPKPCHVYLQELISPHVRALKYGVANVTESRMKGQSSKSQFKHKLLYEVLLPTRDDALALEKDISVEFGGYYVEKAWMPDGYTETLSYDLKDEVIAYIKSVTK